MIREPTPDEREDDSTHPTPATAPSGEPANDDLDLDLEEVGDGDRLKEGFTGQER